ncbi:EamA family transporter [Nocardioides sp. GY 10127]|uniref:EamA family transporter n=1 Tax=Nocardioides sp. GY 10127 TaxID=2569762 RepID=UPI0010A78C2F|nr:EamA family transporter [Nocardioides sp. GY 10127]TIC85418.1 EamA family transporter [Nocardioides sp. GY 10127]
MAVLLALASAVAYGLSDFVAGLAAGRVGAWAAAFLGQLTGALVVCCLGLGLGGSPGLGDLGWAVVAGVGGGLGTAFLYRGLSTGRMGVVAPVSGVGAVVIPVVVGLGLGERPGLMVGIGILAALPGIWLVALEPGGADAPAPGPAPADGSSDRRALQDGLLAGAGFGVLFVGLSRIPHDAGLLPVALNHVVAAVVVAVVASVLGASWFPRGSGHLRGSAAAVGAGLLGAGATTTFLLASHGGYLTVVSVLASLYPAVTVALAALVLRERIHRTQGVGLALCALAVGLVAAG